MLPRPCRLTQSADYARVRREGRSRAHPLLILAAAPNGGDAVRVGFTVGKKVGPAVTRNRAKRLLREAIHARLPSLAPGHDIVLIARPDTAGARLDALGAALDGLLRRGGLVRPAPGSPGTAANAAGGVH